MAKPIPWTTEQEEWLRENVHGHSYVEYATEFNKVFGTDYKLTAISGKAKRLGLLTGRRTRFGQVDATEIRPTGHKPNSGCFNKGNKPKNYLPVGSLRKTSMGFWQIKIAEKLWYDYSRYLWEQEHKREFPQDARVFYIDGDSDHYQLDNIIVVPDNIAVMFSRLMSKMQKRSQELAEANFSIAKLKWAISKAEQKLKGNKEVQSEYKPRYCSKCGRLLKRGMSCTCDARANRRKDDNVKPGTS